MVGCLSRTARSCGLAPGGGPPALRDTRPGSARFDAGPRDNPEPPMGGDLRFRADVADGGRIAERPMVRRSAHWRASLAYQVFCLPLIAAACGFAAGCGSGVHTAPAVTPVAPVAAVEPV